MFYFVFLFQNSCRGRIFGLHKIGIKKIPEHVRLHKQTELEKAKASLLLATLPKSLPCRNKYVYMATWIVCGSSPVSFLKSFYLISSLCSREMEEITAFVKGAICDEQCFGRCLYIHGVPGTGKVEDISSLIPALAPSSFPSSLYILSSFEHFSKKVDDFNFYSSFL